MMTKSSLPCYKTNKCVSYKFIRYFLVVPVFFLLLLYVCFTRVIFNIKKVDIRLVAFDVEMFDATNNTVYSA